MILRKWIIRQTTRGLALLVNPLLIGHDVRITANCADGVSHAVLLKA